MLVRHLLSGRKDVHDRVPAILQTSDASVLSREASDGFHHHLPSIKVRSAVNNNANEFNVYCFFSGHYRDGDWSANTGYIYITGS